MIRTYNIPRHLVEAYRRLSPDDLAECEAVGVDGFSATPEVAEQVLTAICAADMVQDPEVLETMGRVAREDGLAESVEIVRRAQQGDWDALLACAAVRAEALIELLAE